MGILRAILIESCLLILIESLVGLNTSKNPCVFAVAKTLRHIHKIVVIKRRTCCVFFKGLFCTSIKYMKTQDYIRYVLYFKKTAIKNMIAVFLFYSIEKITLQNHQSGCAHRESRSLLPFFAPLGSSVVDHRNTVQYLLEIHEGLDSYLSLLDV